mgnify:CR=1 FL=1
MVQPKNEGYLGNTRIKRSGVETQYTKEELDEYLKCSKDPVHFIEEYCQVISLDEGLVPFKLRGYQQELIEHYDTNRFNVVLASRQSGKSITSCAYLLWYLLFTPEVTVAILANKGAIAREMIGRIVTMLESVPFFLQPGVKILNKGSIEFSIRFNLLISHNLIKEDLDHLPMWFGGISNKAPFNSLKSITFLFGTAINISPLLVNKFFKILINL